MQEVESRQQLETLRRDEKTQARSLANINEKLVQFEERKGKLEEEQGILSTRKIEVSIFKKSWMVTCSVLSLVRR
jgi:structural maintenance of chromosome 1